MDHGAAYRDGCFRSARPGVHQHNHGAWAGHLPGPVVHRLNPNGMLIFSSDLCLYRDLILMSKAAGYAAFRGCVRICGWAFAFSGQRCWVCIGVHAEDGSIGDLVDGRRGDVLHVVIHTADRPLVRWLPCSRYCGGASAAEADGIAGSHTLMKVGNPACDPFRRLFADLYRPAQDLA